MFMYCYVWLCILYGYVWLRMGMYGNAQLCIYTSTSGHVLLVRIYIIHIYKYIYTVKHMYIYIGTYWNDVVDDISFP